VACVPGGRQGSGKPTKTGSTPAVVPGAAPALAKAGVGGYKVYVRALWGDIYTSKILNYAVQHLQFRYPKWPWILRILNKNIIICTTCTHLAPNPDCHIIRAMSISQQVRRLFLPVWNGSRIETCDACDSMQKCLFLIFFSLLLIKR
jgi:hypothetical protein